MTYDKPPSHVQRDALRRALRDHPAADTFLQGRFVNVLKKDELYAGLRALGLDPDQIARDALAGFHVQHVPSPDGYAPQTVTADPDPIAAAISEVLPMVPDAIESELAQIRSLIVGGGFASLDDRLRELVIAAHKPPVEVRVEVEVPALVPGARPIHVAKLSGKTATWRQLFDVRGDLGKQVVHLWDGTHPDTPVVNDRYLWPHPETQTALTQIVHGNNVMLYGPAGTGKTEWAQQLAARCGRPLSLISFDSGTDAATLIGMTTPDAAAGGVSWQDGQLTKAIRTPGCIICLDEPSVARPGVLMVLQNILQYRYLFIAETGERVKVAPGVLFLATDNTNGTGGGARRGYTDTNRLNAAFLDRFGVRIEFSYMTPKREEGVICGYVPGCTPELAALLISAASVTRAAANNQTLSHGIGLRRLLAWAQLLVDGIDAEFAFQCAILNCAPEQDRETLRQQCSLSFNKAEVARALNPSMPAPPPDPTIANPTPAGRNAAGDFEPVS